MTKTWDRVIAVLSLSLVVASAWGYHQDKAATETAMVEQGSIEVSVGQVVEDIRTPFSCSVTNSGSLPLKVRGVAAGCQKSGCILAMSTPDTIPASRSAVFEFDCQGKVPGPFVMNAEIYLVPAEGMSFKVPVTIRGTTLAVETKREAP